MNKYVALKSMVGEVTVAATEGTLHMFDHEVHYDVGDVILEHLNGQKQLISKERLEDGTYIEVEIKKTKIDYNEMANAYASMNSWMTESSESDTYINGTAEIAKKKRECENNIFDTEHYCPHSE